VRAERLVPLRSEGALARALKRHVDGEVRFDSGTRALYATDASSYRIPPIGVVVPNTVDAVVATVEICREHGAPILPRGGGTSLAGQTCNDAVVVDCSRHLTHLEIDAVHGLAHVQPGVVLDQLRNAARACGWDWGPDPSTHDRCTLGGMLGNDSCGVHSVLSEFHGPGPRTSDHVEELEILTYRGERHLARATDDAELHRVLAAGGRIADVYRGLRALRDHHGAEIRARFPDIARAVSGYNLPALLPEHGFHVARALVGSEATLVTILGATLRLAPYLPQRVACILGYDDIETAASHVPAVRATRPAGCEAFDEHLIARLGERPELLPDGKAWLVVEYAAHDHAEATAAARRLASEIGHRGVRVVDEDTRFQHLADIREAALGTTAMRKGEPDAWEGWEDSAVPPEKLAPYLRDFAALLRDHGLHGALYGHFGQGCVHVRIDFELRTDAGVARYRRFTEAAADLVVHYGGSLSGEHGDGQSRSDLLPRMFGERICGAFAELKALWDPDGGMNPGRIVHPRPRTADLRIHHYHPDPGPIALEHGDDGKDFGHAAMRCVGVGKCRKVDSGAMCPSYMVTRDERHSTRGRAHLLFEMLDGDLVRDGWRSTEVAEALDLCLACKACKHECPMHVDMAAYKAEFLAHHYAGRRRPRSAYAFGWIHRWLALGRAMPRVANFATHAPVLRKLARWIAGVSPSREVPRLAPRSFRASFRPLPTRGHRGRVVLWPDTWNDAFYPEVLHASARVLAAAGYHVELPRRRLCCGRPLFEYGWLEPARKQWMRTFETLGDEIVDRTPVVSVEPSCASSFRDELRSLFPDQSGARLLSEQTRTLGELLAEIDWQPPPAAGALLFHGHCHERAVLSPDREIGLLERMGHEVTRLDAGCCGMAGPFGFQTDKYDVSVALAERALLPAMRRSPEVPLVTDGFSCREQVRQLAGVRPRHVAEVIAEALPEPGGRALCKSSR
jgi:FAD/FMN-containing dehydrogenase/Fe-S oxidoreductase